MTTSALTKVSEQLCFGGKQIRFTHTSTVLNCAMQFSVFLPPQAETQAVPALYWLSGLTCTDENFSAKAGVPNAFGVVGSDANAIAPGKRMLSSMTPSLLLKDGKIELVIGTPGGSTIFTSIFQVMTNLYDYQLPLSEAVAAPRFHHQLLPKDQITMEPYAPLSTAVQDELKAKGYQLVTQGWNLGDIQAIQVLDGKVTAAADPRSRGIAKVINLH